MATVQVNGSSSVVGTYYTGGSTKNKGGVAVYVSNSTTLDSKPLIGVNVGVYGSIVVNGVGTSPALNAGRFAYNNQRPIAPRVTSQLATVDNGVLLSGASVPVLTRSIAYTESFITNKTSTAFRQGFNLFTGRYINAVNTVADSFGSDNAARVNYSAPGTLVYNMPRRPAVVAYKAKTN